MKSSLKKLGSQAVIERKRNKQQEDGGRDFWIDAF